MAKEKKNSQVFHDLNKQKQHGNQVGEVKSLTLILPKDM